MGCQEGDDYFFIWPLISLIGYFPRGCQEKSQSRDLETAYFKLNINPFFFIKKNHRPILKATKIADQKPKKREARFGEINKSSAKAS